MNSETKFKVTNLSKHIKTIRINGRDIILRKGDSFKTDYPPEQSEEWKVIDLSKNIDEETTDKVLNELHKKNKEKKRKKEDAKAFM